MFDALYLSPHFDDVVFSCGASIVQRVKHGEHIAVATICAAFPPIELSPFAMSLHERWSGLGEFNRAEEDRQALKQLGANHIHLNYHDCIYRRSSSGEWLYASEESLWGDLSVSDLEQVEALAQMIRQSVALKPNAEIWSPFAIGEHVDHKWVKLAAAALGRMATHPVRYYADYPYAEKFIGGIPLPCDESDRLTKLNAMRCYTSQLSTFWRDDTAIIKAVNSWQERVIQ